MSKDGHTGRDRVLTNSLRKPGTTSEASCLVKTRCHTLQPCHSKNMIARFSTILAACFLESLQAYSSVQGVPRFKRMALLMGILRIRIMTFIFRYVELNVNNTLDSRTSRTCTVLDVEKTSFGYQQLLNE